MKNRKGKGGGGEESSDQEERGSKEDSFPSKIGRSVLNHLQRIMESEDFHAEPGDLDGLIQRFLHLKEVTTLVPPPGSGPAVGDDLDGSFADDELLKGNGQLSACDYQWFNEEMGFGTFDEIGTGSPLCTGINTDYDVANIDMETPFKSEMAGRCERVASLTGSILQQLEAYPDSVTSGQESNDLNNSMEMSICKSENLFSPLVDNQPEIPAMSTFSTDSLDVRSDILANCTATNHHNYTIAFNGNNIMEESYNTLSSAYRTANGSDLNENGAWKRTSTRNGGETKLGMNNNGSSNSSSSQWTVDNTSHLFTQSCPNVKVYIKRPIFDLGSRCRGQLYNRPDSSSPSERSSTPSSSDNNSDRVSYRGNRLDRTKPTTTTQMAEIIKKSIQIQTSCVKLPQCRIGVSQSTPVYICYPNYTLPDLNFLTENDPNDVYLIPTRYKVPLREKSRPVSAGVSRSKRPMSCNDLDELRKQDLSHIKDWPSLHFLLPDEYRVILKDMNKKSEENHEDEKSPDVGMGLEQSPVVMRKKMNNVTTAPEKRYSLNPTLLGQGSGNVGKPRRFSKRFSLQEPIIPEINEITNEINKNLRVLTEIEADLFEPIGDGVAAPQNTPRISFIDNHENVGARAVPTAGPRMSRMTTEKQDLTEPIISAVSEIQTLCKSSRTSLTLGITSKSAGGKCMLDLLCPTLYSLMSDGLCPFLDTIFGKIPNTVWRVIEASIQYGPTAQPLSELVMKINSEECLAEGPMKFNAFISGLLNLGNLSSWLIFLRTKERLLRTHYHPTGLMFLCNTSTRSMYDKMVESVNYLTKLPFQLDIFHEAKVLHQSILSNKIKHSQRSSTAGAPRSASASLPHRKHSQVDSNKLVYDHTKLHYATKNSKYYVNQLKKTQMKRSFSDERPNPSKVPIGTSIPKSKTSQNIHSEKYSSVPRLTKYSTTKGNNRRSSVEYEVRAKDRDKLPRPKSLGNPTQLLQMEEFSKENAAGEKNTEKFRNLRLQWELLTSDEVKGRPHAGLGSPGSVASKIPRPISSPVKTAPNFPQNVKLAKR